MSRTIGYCLGSIATFIVALLSGNPLGTDRAFFSLGIAILIALIEIGWILKKGQK